MPGVWGRFALQRVLPREEFMGRGWFASTRPINCGIAARCDAAHKKSPLEPRVRAGSGSTQATDEAALSYRALTRGGGRRGGLTRRGTLKMIRSTALVPASV